MYHVYRPAGVRFRGDVLATKRSVAMVRVMLKRLVLFSFVVCTLSTSSFMHSTELGKRSGSTQ